MPADDRLPLVNQNLLHELEEDFDDPAPVRSFAHDFITFWDERYLRLADAVKQGDAAASLDALLSVRIASTMVGAVRLARFAAELELSLKRGHLEAVSEALPALQTCGKATIRELNTSYIDVDC
jgi:HPt (histidine-containing phosphotransfer) domain-containing protein